MNNRPETVYHKTFNLKVLRQDVDKYIKSILK